MSAATDQIVETISIENLKTIAGASAAAQAQLSSLIAPSIALAVQNAVANQQQMNSIDRAATGAIVNKLIHMDTEEASAIVKTNTGNDVSSQLQSLLASLSSGQVGSKIAGNTPPVTPTEVRNPA